MSFETPMGWNIKMEAVKNILAINLPVQLKLATFSTKCVMISKVKSS